MKIYVYPERGTWQELLQREMLLRSQGYSDADAERVAMSQIWPYPPVPHQNDKDVFEEAADAFIKSLEHFVSAVNKRYKDIEHER